MDDKLREIKRKHATPLGYGHMLSDEDIDYLIEQAKKLVDELEAILTLPQKEDAECTCRPNPYNKFHSEPPLLTDVNCPIHGKKDSPEVEKVDWTSFEAGYLPTQHTFHNAILELKRRVDENRADIMAFDRKFI